MSSKVTLGSTGLEVSRLGLGMAALGRPGYINLGHSEDLPESHDVSAMQQQAHEVLDAAYEQGIRYFDAARSYGKAEQFLGSWLEYRPEISKDVTIGSKWGYQYTADWQVDAEVHEQKEHSLTRLQTQWQETQSELGHWLNLYQIHSATLESDVLDNQNVLRELSRLKESGTAIGLSVSGPKQSEVIEKSLTISHNGQLLFDTVQATWNILERSAGTALKKAHQAGMGIIVKESLANGRLTARNEATESSDLNSILHRWAMKFHTSIDAFSMAFVLSNPWVDVVLSGAATVEHLVSNCRASNLTLPDDILQQTADLTEAPEEYWQKRSDLSWN